MTGSCWSLIGGVDMGVSLDLCSGTTDKVGAEMVTRVDG